MSVELESSETVVSQEMVRHGNVDETPSVTAAEPVETYLMQDKDAETSDGWLTGWKLPVLSDVVSKTSSVVQQTVQQTSNVVRCHFISHILTLCSICFV